MKIKKKMPSLHYGTRAKNILLYFYDIICFLYCSNRCHGTHHQKTVLWLDESYREKKPFPYVPKAQLAWLKNDLEKTEKLNAIAGSPPNMLRPPAYDAFAERNERALKIDFEREPPFFQVSPTHFAKTWLLDPRAPKVEKPEIIQNIHEKMQDVYNI